MTCFHCMVFHPDNLRLWETSEMYDLVYGVLQPRKIIKSLLFSGSASFVQAAAMYPEGTTSQHLATIIWNISKYEKRIAGTMCSRICMYIPLYTPYASCMVHYFHLGHYLMVNMPWSICMYLCLYLHMHTTWQPSNMMNHQKDKLFHLGAKILSWSWTPQPRSSAVACQTTWTAWTWGNREEYLQGVESVGYLSGRL